MKYSWKYKFDLISFFTSLIPLGIVVYVSSIEDNLFNLIISLLVGIGTLIQVFKSRQKDVITIEHKILYKKSLFGKIKEIDLTKYNEFHLEGLGFRQVGLDLNRLDGEQQLLSRDVQLLQFHLEYC